ncbi:MAG: hypothetical protein ACPGSL_07020, partial [Vicingaceae bacterium]
MKELLISCLFLFASINISAQTNPSFFNQTNNLLKTYVTDGKVDYESLKGNNQLTELIANVSTFDLSKQSDIEK